MLPGLNLKTIRFIRSGHGCSGVEEDSVTLCAVEQHGTPLCQFPAGAPAQLLPGWAPGGRGIRAVKLPGFNGERVDPLSYGYLLGNGYRFYSPGLGRFYAPDSLSPFGSGGFNPYAYCAGDPVNHTDPSGHLSWQAITGITLGALGLVFSVVTMGMSVAAAGGVLAAISSTSCTTMIVGGLGGLADATGIASGILEATNPQASSVLGWISFATGLAGAEQLLGKVRLQRSELGELKNAITAGDKMLDTYRTTLHNYSDVLTELIEESTKTKNELPHINEAIENIMDDVAENRYRIDRLRNAQLPQSVPDTGLMRSRLSLTDTVPPPPPALPPAAVQSTPHLNKIANHAPLMTQLKEFLKARNENGGATYPDWVLEPQFPPSKIFPS